MLGLVLDAVLALDAVVALDATFLLAVTLEQVTRHLEQYSHAAQGLKQHRRIRRPCATPRSPLSSDLLRAAPALDAVLVLDAVPVLGARRVFGLVAVPGQFALFSLMLCAVPSLDAVVVPDAALVLNAVLGLMLDTRLVARGTVPSRWTPCPASGCTLCSSGAPRSGWTTGSCRPPSPSWSPFSGCTASSRSGWTPVSFSC